MPSGCTNRLVLLATVARCASGAAPLAAAGQETAESRSDQQEAEEQEQHQPHAGHGHARFKLSLGYRF